MASTLPISCLPPPVICFLNELSIKILSRVSSSQSKVSLEFEGSLVGNLMLNGCGSQTQSDIIQSIVEVDMNEVAGRRFEQLIAWRLGVRVTKYMLIILKPSQRIIRGQLMHNLVQHSSHYRHHHHHHHHCHHHHHHHHQGTINAS